MFNRSLLAALLLTTALTVSPAHAQSLPGQKPEAPVLLNANYLTYDDRAFTITAEGDVQLAQGGQTVRADKITFNRATGVVTAEGSVRIWQNTGEMMTATYAELSQDLRQGFVREAAVLLTDNSRFISMEGERTEGRYVRMNRALYTACDLCKDDPRSPPLWQVRAQRIIHDNEKHDVVYRNASLEIAGVPVFYTPYMSHPDPTVKRRSGFLAPVIGARANLGAVARTYYYLDVAPSMDATIETSYSSDRGLLLGGEWRQKTQNGEIKLNMSANVDDIPNDVSGGSASNSQLRGHFFLDATHEFDNNWRATANIRRTSDDTFLDLWNFTDDDILTSNAKVERFSSRSYAAVSVTNYQDLRPNIDAAEPNVLSFSYNAQGEQRETLGGRWALNADSRTISRSRGTDSQRVSLEASWRRDDVMPAGVLLTTEARASVDAYAATNYNNDDPTTARPFTQAQLTARWPLVRVTDRGQQFIEPITQLTIAPRVARNDDDIPNEDSVGLEFDTTNLFRSNRYSGRDRIDGGSRVAYGLRAGWTGNSGASVAGMFGQSYEFSDDPNYPAGSGLQKSFSDFVGNVDVALPGIADATYSLRFDNETFDPREHDLRMSVGPSWLRGSVSYLYIDQTTTDGSSAPLREELGVGGAWQFTDYWTIGAVHRHNLRADGGPLDTNIALTYQDECLTFSLMAERDYLSRTGLSSGDSVFFRVIFKNLGEFESPSFSPDFLGTRSGS